MIKSLPNLTYYTSTLTTKRLLLFLMLTSCVCFLFFFLLINEFHTFRSNRCKSSDQFAIILTTITLSRYNQMCYCNVSKRSSLKSDNITFRQTANDCRSIFKLGYFIHRNSLSKYL